MQTLAAYVIFLLFITGIGLAIIFAAIFSLVASTGLAWLKSRREFRIWQSSISGGLAHAGARIRNELLVLKRVPVFHAHR